MFINYKEESKMIKKVFICIFTLFFCLAFFAKESRANLKWGGCLDFDLTGASQKDSDSTSELVLDAVELSFAAEMNENVGVEAIIKYEEGDVILDEAFATLDKIAHLPLSIKVGQYVLPFGVFESHLINDPITQEKFEINTAGVSLGYAPEALSKVNFDFSLSLYSNDGLFTTSDPNEADLNVAYSKTFQDNLGHYILNASISPVEFLSLSLFFDSESGDDERNNSLGAAANITFDKFSVDVEYITAIERNEILFKEMPFTDANVVVERTITPKESVYSISAAYQLLPSVEIAARFEGYDDDISGNQTQDEAELNGDDDEFIGLKNTASIGASYEVYENATLSAEYRATDYENAPTVNDWTIRLSVEFE